MVEQRTENPRVGSSILPLATRLLSAIDSADVRDRWSYNAATMMVRTQISIEAELRSRIRERTAGLGISMAEYFRQLVERDLSQPRRNVDRSAIFNLGASSGTDVASQKDRMAAQATGSSKLR